MAPWADRVLLAISSGRGLFSSTNNLVCERQNSQGHSEKVGRRVLHLASTGRGGGGCSGES